MMPQQTFLLRWWAPALVCIGLLGSAAQAGEPTARVQLFVTDYMAAQTSRVSPLNGKATDSAWLFATPGEYEPVSFAVRPTVRVEQMFIHAEGLAGPAGPLPKEAVRVQSVEGYHGGGRDILMDLGGPWDMPAYRRELFWVTVHVPTTAKPGDYRGRVVVTGNGKELASLHLTLTVLPFTLDEPPFALGFNYSWPKDSAVLRAQLRDMREHGMTTVAPLYDFHLPVYDEDTSELGEFLEAYRAAGFTKPVYFATPMNLSNRDLIGYGAVDSKPFQRKYLQVMRRLWNEVQKHDTPVIFSIADELTNKGMPGVRYGEQLARLCYEELPEVCVTSDMNGYREVMTMAPYLNIAAFNNGWDGADGHNKGRRLLNGAFLRELKKTGAIPWFVNGGVGRFAFGVFFWKMSGFGVRGKVEWYYRLGNNRPGSIVRTRGATVWPTLDYERSREGVDDLKYLLKLQSLVAQSGAGAKEPANVRQARRLLQRLQDAVIDNWTAYREGGEVFPPASFRPAVRLAKGPVSDYNRVRLALAEAIIALQ